MARKATAVFPDPTSPCRRRIMGRGRAMSALISFSTRSWPAVSSNPRRARAPVSVPGAPPKAPRHIPFCRPTHAGHAEAQQQEVIEGEAPFPRLRLLHLLGKVNCPESLGKGHEGVTMEDPVRKEVLNVRAPRQDEVFHEAPKPPLEQSVSQGIHRDNAARVSLVSILPRLVILVHHLEPRTPTHFPRHDDPVTGVKPLLEVRLIKPFFH